MGSVDSLVQLVHAFVKVGVAARVAMMPANAARNSRMMMVDR